MQTLKEENDSLEGSLEGHGKGGSCEVHHCPISSLLVSPSRKLLVPGLLDLLDLLSSAKPTSFQAPNQQRAEKLKGEWLVMEESKVEYRV